MPFVYWNFFSMKNSRFEIQASIIFMGIPLGNLCHSAYTPYLAYFDYFCSQNLKNISRVK